VPYQLEELIVKPLHSVRNSFPSCLVILDALDECKDDRVTSIILSSLSRHVTELSPIKFLITSRPEQNITGAFKLSSQLSPLSRPIILHEIELGIVQQDIELYLTSSLSQIREAYYLDNCWPSASDTRALAMLSNGLFIFAATSVNFIRDRNYSCPADQLASLLTNAPTVVQSWGSPHRRLDELYAQVLIHAFPHITPPLADRLKIVLGSIILLRDPLSPLALEQLLKLRPATVRQTLVHLHSVVMVPESEIHVIRLLHPSFFDFMTDPSRCRNADFVVDSLAQHTLLVHACLDSMMCLTQDICNIKNPSLLNSEVDDLPSRILKYIPLHVQYACRHWAFHLINASISDVLLDLVKQFCSKCLLYWVEVCSLLGELRKALIGLHGARQFLVDKATSAGDSISLLLDCERLSREFFPILSISCLQVYHSALLFTPKKTLLYEMYGHHLGLPIKMHHAVEDTWNLCIRTMDGHSGDVLSVAFSPDGVGVVSGSLDGTLRLWDVVSGAHLCTLEGNFSLLDCNLVYTAAFSPDGTRIMSGWDNTLRLWDAISGIHLNTLHGHSELVQSVAFSPDGTRVVSGSWDNTLRLWDAVSGAHLNTIEGHSSSVTSVAFSPDGTHVVSGSWDRTLRLWDVSGAHLSTLEGHSSKVSAVAFSPDGARVVSGSWDSTLRLWDAVSGAHVHTLEGHSNAVSSVAFSPDSTRILSGSWDHTLRLWDAVNGAHLNTLTGHFDWVNSVAFSPDSMCVLSASNDNTLRLWEAVSSAHHNTFERHSDQINSVSFSPDGTYVVSGSSDHTLRLWDAGSGVHIRSFEGHSDLIHSVAFSPDGTLVVSGSRDHTLRLWGAVSGAHLKTLEGHSSSVTSVAFSPDGTRVVSGSRDDTLRLWDVVSSAHLKMLGGHSSPVTSVAFSPDGTRVVSGSVDSTLRLWDAVSGAHLKTLQGHSCSVTSVAFSLDGTRVVSRSHDKSLRLWDAVSGTHLNTLEESVHTTSVAFPPDGTRIVSDSISYNQALRLWDALNGVYIDTLHETINSVYSHPYIARSVACSLYAKQSSFFQSVD
jgi:WD40 repeat protein